LAEEGACILRVPSSQAAAGQAGWPPGSPARRWRSGTGAVAPDVSAAAAGLAKFRASVGYLVKPRRSINPLDEQSAPTDKENHYSIL
jgi:hypothetical protein